MIEVELRQTCSACPEQYDMYIDCKNIGYFRTRHGYFTVEYLLNETQVFASGIKGDGGFDPEERDFFLEEGIKAVLEAHTGIENDFSYTVL